MLEFNDTPENTDQNMDLPQLSPFIIKKTKLLKNHAIKSNNFDSFRNVTPKNNDLKMSYVHSE